MSRVDTEVDKRLEGLGREELQGTAAVANARAAYQHFKEIFQGERFAALREAGARVQRPLWASTGVKNPHYPETKYVDDLVAPDTVNTMPMQTLLAAAERSEVRGRPADQDPSEHLEALAGAGIDMADVTAQAARRRHRPVREVDRGPARGRRRAAATRSSPIARRRSRPRSRPSWSGAIAERVETAVEESVAQRVWRKDPTLWGAAGTPEIENRLGWLTISEPMLEHAGDLRASPTRCAATASPTSCCWAWAAPRSAPR